MAVEDVQYAVFPETAISGYDFTEIPHSWPPLWTPIPGGASEAWLPLLRHTGMSLSMGIAEKDAVMGIPYNMPVLLGPEGIVGKFRMDGRNGQDVQLFGSETPTWCTPAWRP